MRRAGAGLAGSAGTARAREGADDRAWTQPGGPARTDRAGLAATAPTGGRMKREPFRVLSLVIEQPWAITARALDTILDVLERPASDLEAVSARLGRPLDNTGGGV